jgi:hypothetical protein
MRGYSIDHAILSGRVLLKLSEKLLELLVLGFKFSYPLVSLLNC